MFRTWWNLSNSQGVEKNITFFHVLRKFSQCKHHFWRQSVNVNLRRLKAEDKSLHNNTHLSPAQIFRLIDRDVRNTITSRRHKRSFTKLMALWIRWLGSFPFSLDNTRILPIDTKLLPFLKIQNYFLSCFFLRRFSSNFCQESCM